jgi:hypothetical protein
MTKINEMDLEDKHGNIVISPDLKVRHKKSQYEYTVDSVAKDDAGELVVLLRMPEEPRIDQEDQVASPDLMKDLSGGSVLYEVDPSVEIYEPDEEEPESEEDLLAVPKSEFEKEYEVK